MRRPDNKLPKPIRHWVPEVALQADAGENPPHLVRLGAAGVRLQAGGVPRGRQYPQLVEAH